MSSSHIPTRKKVGSVRKLPNGRWEVRVSHGYRMDGRPRVLRDVCDTEQDAKARAYELALELGRDVNLDFGRTLAQVWRAYLQDRKGVLAGTTMDAYTWHMESVILPALGNEDVSRITHASIQSLLSSLSHGVAAKTRTVLSSVLTWAVKHEMLGENVMRRADFELPQRVVAGDFDADPFAAIEGTRDVWSVQTVLECFGRIRGLPLEPVWLACVGAGLRVEEALALRKMDVRRVQIGERLVVQVAVHAATTKVDARKGTKTSRSVRIAAVMEPFGSRFWELVESLPEPASVVCDVSAANQNKRWRSYFDEPPEYHKRMAESRKVAGRLHGLPYIPLSRMRATHETIMQEAGVLDSLNAAVHGHSQAVSRKYYMRGEAEIATSQAEDYLTLVG